MASGREEPPPSKKRVALRQISKDDDPDSEDDGGGATGGTFRRASDEVLAERRIVKVRRTPVPSSGPNPFASIRLVAPSVPLPPVPPPVFPLNSTNSTLAEVLGGDSGVETSPSAVQGGVSVDQVVDSDDVVDQKSVEVDKSPLLEHESVGPGVEVEDTAGVSQKEQQITADVTTDSTGVGDETNGLVNEEEEQKARGGELVGPSGSSSETFEQLSSAKNAFAGSFGTGFSSTPSTINSSSASSPQVSAGFTFGQPFTFGSQRFGSSFSFGTGQSQSSFGSRSEGGAFPSVSSVFGKSNGSASTPFFGSLTPSAASPASVHSKPVVSLQEVHVETGEEKEKAIFTADAALFEFLDGGWKERGKGELRLNVSEEKDKKPRLVMRSKGNYRLLLNASLFPDMKLSKMDNRGISFVCANSATEGKTGLTTYALRLKDSVVASEFTASVQAHKGNANSEPRTPESSPKATERPAKAVETNPDVEN